MREYSSPPVLEIPPTGSLADDVVRWAQREPERVTFSRADPVDDTWREVSSSAFHDEVRAVAKGLLAGGLEHGDRVALWSRTRYEWTLLDYACWYAGLVTVPIYATASPDHARWVVSDSQARAALVEGSAQRAELTEPGELSGRRALPLTRAWALDEDALTDLAAQGRPVTDEALERRRRAVTPLDVATVVYTSGTTGPPKGCMLTHGNFLAELSATTELLDDLFTDPGAGTVLFLPLPHIFARLVQVGCVRSGARLAHCSDIARLLPDLLECRPTFLLAVPRVLERLYTQAAQRAAIDGHGATFNRAAEHAIAWSQAQEQGQLSLSMRARHTVWDRRIYAGFRELLGGRCRYVVSGGAPLGERLGHFFRGVGVMALEGYGLTESTAALTAGSPTAHRIGTVGRPLPGTTVRVNEDGELLFRGPQIFVGYWQDDEATRRVLTPDGWLHTGDLGEVDEEGLVRITGRKHEILVTAGGKRVAPAPLEERVRAHHLVSQCLVVGDGRPFVAALVTLDPEALQTWAAGRGKAGTPAGLVDDPDLRAEVQQGVDDANATVSQAESIRRFRLLAVDWSEEAGQLTPSLKLRRAVVAQDFQDDIEALYAR